jgi:hypothetical protein
MKSPKDKNARLILNHSTHLPGLILLLSCLAEQPGIKTITPGRLARAKGRPTSLRLRVTVPISGGFKLQARAQGNVQEVFVVTTLNAAELQQALDCCQQNS